MKNGYEKCLEKIDNNDPFRTGKIAYIEKEPEKKWRMLTWSVSYQRWKVRQKLLIKVFKERYSNASNNAKVKLMLNFHFGDSNSKIYIHKEAE